MTHFETCPVFSNLLLCCDSYLSLCQCVQVLYVLQLHQDHAAGTVQVSSVSEFLLAQPVLSFALLDAGRRRLVKAQEYDAEHAWSCTTGMLTADVHLHRL